MQGTRQTTGTAARSLQVPGPTKGRYAQYVPQLGRSPQRNIDNTYNSPYSFHLCDNEQEFKEEKSKERRRMFAEKMLHPIPVSASGAPMPYLLTSIILQGREGAAL